MAVGRPSMSGQISRQAAMDTAKQAGALHGAYLQELLADHSAGKRNDRAAQRSMVAQLRELRLISASEKAALGTIVDALHDAKPAKASAKSVEGIFNRLQAAADASPLAVAVAGVALDSIQTVAKEKKGEKGTSAADLGGALSGGGIGARGGGLWGGILGAVIGGVGASYLAKRDQAKA